MTADHLARRVADCLHAREGTGPAWNIEIEDVREGTARVAMVVREDMINGHGICQGGLVTALADSCFAFACNAYDEVTVASGFDVDLVAPGRLGDVLTARAVEVNKSGRLGVYDVEVRNQRDERVCVFRGRSYTMKGKPVVA